METTSSRGATHHDDTNSGSRSSNQGSGEQVIKLMRESYPFLKENQFDPVLQNLVDALGAYIAHHEKQSQKNRETAAEGSVNVNTKNKSNAAVLTKPVNVATPEAKREAPSSTTAAAEDALAAAHLSPSTPQQKQQLNSNVSHSSSSPKQQPSPLTKPPPPTQSPKLSPTSPQTSTAASTTTTTRMGAPPLQSPTSRGKEPSSSPALTRNNSKAFSPAAAASSARLPGNPPLSITPIPTVPIPAELRVEQQKKLAAERRRKDLELQRKLARAEQKLRDICAKREFLATERRKKELVCAALMSSSSNSNNNNKNKDPLAQLQQIKEKMAQVEKEKQHQTAEIASIRAEIEARKQQQEEGVMDQSTSSNEKWNLKIVQERRAAEEAAKRLESEKRAAEKRRQLELEAERQRARQEIKRQKEEKHRKFMEQVSRKEELIAQAKVAKSGLSDTELLEKLNKEMSGLDFEGGQNKSTSNIVDNDADEGHSVNFSKAINNRGKEQQHHGDPIPESKEAQSKPNLASDGSTEQQDPSLNDPNGRQPKKPHYQNGGSYHPQRSAESFFDSASSKAHSAPWTPDANTNHHPSGSDQKYVRMAQQNGGDDNDNVADADSESIKRMTMKRNILTQWALQPPQMQFLRPIYDLLCTIQTAYPPHPHFESWTPILPSDLGASTNPPYPASFDEKKLSKAVRKLRFFLHPDKLPRDLTDDHQFVCELLWSVTSDAWEDYKKAKEEMDWMN